MSHLRLTTLAEGSLPLVRFSIPALCIFYANSSSRVCGAAYDTEPWLQTGGKAGVGWSRWPLKPVSEKKGSPVECCPLPVCAP